MENVFETLKKAGISEEEMKAKYNELYSLNAELMTPEQRKQSAESRLYLFYKPVLNTPTSEFEGIISADTGPMDLWRARFNEAKRVFAEDPIKAQQNGYTNENGEPLEAMYHKGGKKNIFGGAVLRQTPVRIVSGTAREKKKDGTMTEWKDFSVTMNGNEYRDIKYPLNVPVGFRVIKNPQTNPDSAPVFLLSTNARIMFSPREIEVKEKPNVEAFLKKVYKNNTYKIGELVNLCKSVPKIDYDILTEGFVTVYKLELTSNGNRTIVLDDPEDTSGRGLLAFLPPHLFELADFAPMSKVMVVGRPSFVQAKESNQQDSLFFSISGIYALPQFKIPIKKEVKLLKEEDFKVEKKEEKKSEEPWM